MMISQSVLINGNPQWIYIHLCEKPRATLLFVHGGPGWSDAPWAGVICEKIWSEFNTVHWDQRGSNRSYSKGSASASVPLSINQMVSDGLELVRILDAQFNLRNPILVGHSWGALLGVLMANQAPQLFHSYVGIGQLVANEKSEILSLDFCISESKKRNRIDLATELIAMGPDFYKDVKTLFRQREIVFELGGELVSPSDQKQFASWIQQSPIEYQSPWELLYESCGYSVSRLWQEMIQVNLFNLIPSLDLPTTVIQGRFDYCTASSVAKEWFDLLQCSGRKQFVWFEKSAHWPQLEENEKFSALFLSTSFY